MPSVGICDVLTPGKDLFAARSRIKAPTQPSIEMSKAQQTPDFDAGALFECRSCVCCFRNTFLFPPFSNLQ